MQAYTINYDHNRKCNQRQRSACRSACTMQLKRFYAAYVWAFANNLCSTTNTNIFIHVKFLYAWFRHTNEMSVPRSRLPEHGEHPAHFVHLHFLAQRLGWVAHHGLHSPAVWGLVVVVSVVSVVVTGSSPSRHEQQGSPAMSFVHLRHSKNPPCAIQAFMFLSSSHIGSEDADGTGVVAGCVDGAGVVFVIV